MENPRNISRYIIDFDTRAIIIMGFNYGELLHAFVLNSKWESIYHLVKTNNFQSYYDNWTKIITTFPTQEQIDVKAILEKIKANQSRIKELSY
jgi:hypothetical protein